MNENKKEMYTGILKVQQSNKSRSEVFSGTIRVSFKGHSLFQGEGEGEGEGGRVIPMIVSFFTC